VVQTLWCFNIHNHVKGWMSLEVFVTLIPPSSLCGTLSLHKWAWCDSITNLLIPECCVFPALFVKLHLTVD